ncbi:MAG: hypothetical protein MK207_11550 [Saprospiraceae bacterium]|nr:hypothetical protein [Saprospiraceae bacterium]
MHKTKLITLLEHLNSREFARFIDFVHSPFYNKHEEVKKLCIYLSKYFSNPKRKNKLDKQRVYKNLFPNKTFDANALHGISSKLLTLLHDFLVIDCGDNNNNFHLIKVLEELRKRKQFKDYDAIIRKITKNNNGLYTDVEELYWEKYAYHKEIDINFLTQGGRTYNENLQLKNDYLDLFFITKKLKIACDMVSRNRIIGSDYQYRLVDELFVYLDQPDSSYSQEPTIKIYASILKMLLHGEENDDEYYRVKDWLVQYMDVFSKLELKNIYDYLENHCIRKYKKNTADETYLIEMLDISKFLVKHKINFIDGYLLDGDYKNIGTSAINLGDFDWAQEFIETYKEALIPRVRQSAYSYLMSFLLYSKKDYKGALQALNDVSFTNWTYHAGAKLIQMRIYYELDEADALYALADAFKIYLKRNKQLTELDRVPYMNFINLTRKSYRLKEDWDFLKKEKLTSETEKLKKLFETATPVASRVWLQEVIDELIF